MEVLYKKTLIPELPSPSPAKIESTSLPAAAASQVTIDFILLLLVTSDRARVPVLAVSVCTVSKQRNSIRTVLRESPSRSRYPSRGTGKNWLSFDMDRGQCERDISCWNDPDRITDQEYGL